MTYSQGSRVSISPAYHEHWMRNLIIQQVNINGLRNKLEELKLLIHDTHADIITIQETKLTPKAKTPKIHNFTAVRTDRLHKAGGGLITLIRDNITFTTTNIPSTINTHNTELQMVKVHINNTKHITIANIYIPPRDTTSTHYKTADADIQHCIQYITNISHSVLTGNVPLLLIFWKSLEEGCLPESWKQAKITPIHKKKIDKLIQQL